MTLCVCVCVCGNALLQSQACCMPCSFTFLSGADFLHSCTFLDPESRHRVKDTFQNQAKNICARIVLPSMFIFGGSLQVMFYISGMCCFDPSMDRGELWPMAEALGQGFWPSYSALPQPRVIDLCHSSGPWPLGYTPLGHGSWPRPMAMALVHDPCHP